jgi:N-acetylglucosamine-6-phosphate deacetylase
MSEKPWPELWAAMSTRPAEWLGLKHQLNSGEAASFCLFQTEPTPTLQETWHNGQKTFSAS